MAMYQEEPGKVSSHSNIEEFRARSYQLEMLERSLNGNAIIAVRLSENDSSHKADIECRWTLGAARLRCGQLEPSRPARTN
jgi:hypothetical protein